MTSAETELWRQWKTRSDRAAFQRLITSHEAFVRDFARRVCGHDADAEDISQEAFLELAEAPLDRPLQVGLRAFLGRRIVLASKTLRRAALSRARREAQAPPPVEPPEAGIQLETQEALALLDEEERHFVVLRFLHDLSYAEVAAVLGTSEGAARVRVHRALTKLRSRLGPRAEHAVAALPLLLGSGGGFACSTAVAAVLKKGVFVMSVSAKRYLLVALVLLIVGGGGVVTVRAYRAEEARPRAEARAPDQARPTPPPTKDERAQPPAESPAELPVTSPAKRVDPPLPEGARAARRPQRLVGRISFSDETPLRNTLVGLAENESMQARTDTDGRFDLPRLIDGPVDLFICGTRRYALTIARIPASGSAVQIELERGVTLEGSIRLDDTREPVEGAMLELRRPGAAASGTPQAKWGRTVTDGRGRFQFGHLLRARYEITVTAPGVEPMTVDPDLRRGSEPLHVLVRRARELTVRFADLPASLRGTRVSLAYWAKDDRRLTVWFRDREIDDRGEIRIAAPPPGRYGINIHPPRGELRSMVAYAQAAFEIADGSPAVVLLERAAGGADVEGAVILPDGSSASHRLVRLERSQRSARTGSDGQFRFESVPAGEETLVLRDHLTDIRLDTFAVPAEGVVRRIFRITGTGVVKGRFPESRTGINSYLMLSTSAGRRGAQVHFGMGGDGSFRIPFLDPGDYVLVAGVLKKGSLKRDLRVVRGEVDVGTLTLVPMAEVEVTVGAPAGVKLAGEFRVTAAGTDSMTSGWLALADDGRGRLRLARAGRYTIRFTVPGCAPFEREVEVGAGATPLSFTLARE